MLPLHDVPTNFNDDEVPMVPLRITDARNGGPTILVVPVDLLLKRPAAPVLIPAVVDVGVVMVKALHGATPMVKQTSSTCSSAREVQAAWLPAERRRADMVVLMVSDRGVVPRWFMNRMWQLTRIGVAIMSHVKSVRSQEAMT